MPTLVQVEQLLEAQRSAAQALVLDLAACERDSCRAFTNNAFYKEAVDQMHRGLQGIQAADEADKMLQGEFEVSGVPLAPPVRRSVSLLVRA